MADKSYIEIRKGEYMNPYTYEVYDYKGNHLYREPYDSMYIPENKNKLNNNNIKKDEGVSNGAPENEGCIMAFVFAIIYGVSAGLTLGLAISFIVFAAFGFELKLRYIVVFFIIYFFLTFYKKTDVSNGFLILHLIITFIVGSIVGVLIGFGLIFLMRSNLLYKDAYGVLMKCIFFTNVAAFFIIKKIMFSEV